MTYSPREGGTIDRAVKFLQSVDGRPVKATDLAVEIDAVAASISQLLGLGIANGLIFRVARGDGLYYCLPGCQEMEPWRRGQLTYTDPSKPFSAPEATARNVAVDAAPAAAEVAAAPAAAEAPTLDTGNVRFLGKKLPAGATIEETQPAGEDVPADGLAEHETSEFGCAYWNNGELELRDGETRILLSREKTETLLEYLGLFKARPVEESGSVA